ncbi:DUF4435 domain-containing protein [Flavobacterium johnsoniae]|uniref:DUF4435 domain-containing protein n=1 Tax=Flavobacterium johnsoniae TaxID=986 RepID=UPI003D9857AB
MIERLTKSKSAVSVLMEDFNDIDIYVEDTAIESKKIYTEILNRILLDKYKIESIIPLGGSTQVIKEWRNNKDKKDNRLKVYIIDGDYIQLNNLKNTFLKDDEIDNHKGLFILPRYCIENFLIDFEAISEIIHDEEALDDRETIKQKMDLDLWLKENNIILRDLFIYNAICMKYDVGEKTSKYKLVNLLKEPGFCCENLINKRIDYLKEKIKQKKHDIDLEHEYSERFLRIQKLNIISIVTGKDYLFPLIKQYISTKYDCLNMSQISLKIRLSKRCDVSEIKVLENELI